jgi:nucleotide-binding universal stress UspA family protein
MFKDVLVHIDSAEAGAGRLTFALQLTEPWQARISGVHVVAPVDVSPAVGVAKAEHVAANLATAQRRNARAAEDVFRETIAPTNRAHHWTTVEGHVPAALCQEARYADLIIVGQEAFESAPERHPLPIAHSVALHAGRPVLITPPRISLTRPLDRVLVAWDGGREAVRAVHDALPLLQGAARVELAVFNPEEERNRPDARDLQRLMQHLEQHGVTGLSSRVLQGPSFHAAAILEWLTSGDFDLLVAGAYSKPMWFEFIVEGTTQSLLLSSPVPIFVSH